MPAPITRSVAVTCVQGLWRPTRDRRPPTKPEDATGADDKHPGQPGPITGGRRATLEEGGRRSHDEDHTRPALTAAWMQESPADLASGDGNDDYRHDGEQHAKG